ncbi:hypothetical protein HJC23_006410 [Cyclotella cryptica]|uniref:Uncharacterized protein n=1 Tax=Cyclotella cryptica TaxID=29204 RepID=A0ABD3QUZ1_9STRA
MRYFSLAIAGSLCFRLVESIIAMEKICKKAVASAYIV